MKRKKIRQQNIIQIVTAFVFIILLNIISDFAFKRYDLTSEKRYTLSDYTKNMLYNMEQKVYITIFLDGDDLPIPFKNMKNSIKELLDEFVVYSNENIDYEFINPTDEEKTEDERRMVYYRLYKLGIVPVETNEATEGQTTQTMIFPSAVLTYTAFIPNGTQDGKRDTLVSIDVGINLLNNDPNFIQSSEENINNSIQALEYNFINEIQKISRLEKPNIAFIEGHGELEELEVVEASTTLSEYYNVMRGEINGEYGILDNFEAIIIAKPTKKFSKEDKFVIDQYIMNGGKVLWLVDGANVDMDSIYLYQHTFAMPSNVQEINLIDQLFKYGVRINTDIIQDLYCSTILLKGVSSTGEERDHYYNWLYFPVLLTQNDHVINKYIDVIKTEFVSSVDTVGENPDILKTILMTTSEFSKKITLNVPLEIDFDEINNIPNEQTFKSGQQPVAVILEGNFESAFKNQNVTNLMENPNQFIDKSVETKQIVIADGDLIRNVITSNGETYPLGFDKYSLYTYKGNEEFILNAVNYLCDDEGLMTLRSREFKLRLLDKSKIDSNKFLWQIVNTLLPIIIVIIFGVIVFFVRKRKYTK